MRTNGIDECFYCSRPIEAGDCDKVDHDCSQCEYHKCEYCVYCKECDNSETHKKTKAN